MDGIESPISNTFHDVSIVLNLVLELLVVIVNVLPTVVVVKRKRRNDCVVTDELVLALCVTYILAILLTTPVALISYLQTGWTEITCVFHEITSLASHLVSVFLITCMCLDRALVLRRALCYTPVGAYSVDKVKYGVLIFYTMSVFISSLPVMGFGQTEVSVYQNVCESWLIVQSNTTTYSVFYGTFLTLGYSNLGFLIMINISVISMLLKLKKRMWPISSTNRPSNIPELQMQRKSMFEYSWMCFTISILFYLTWCPVLIMLALKRYGLNISDVAILYAFFSNKLAGLLNPFIYGLFSKTYRRGYKQIISSLHMYLCQFKHKEFLPVRAISCENPMEVVEDENTARRSRYHLKKSKSFHDKPIRGGFQNHGLDSSVHSELNGYHEEDRFKRKHSECEKPDFKIKRTRTLSSITHSDNCKQDSAELHNSDIPEPNNSNSSLSSASSDEQKICEYSDATVEKHQSTLETTM